MIAATAFAVTALIDRLGRLLGRFGVAPFFLQLVGAMVATVSTLALFGVGALPAGTQPSLVIAAGITVLLSGLSVVGSVQDAISGYYVTAAGRAAEVGLLSAGLLAGVVLGLKLGVAFALTLDPAAPVSADLGQFGICTFAAATAAGMYALATYAPLRVAARGGSGGRDRLGGVRGAHAVRAPRAGRVDRHRGHVRRHRHRRRAARHRRALARHRAGRDHPLLPGLTAYRGFYQLAVQGVVDGLVTVLLALAIGLALAAGVALGNFVSRPRSPHAVVEPARPGCAGMLMRCTVQPSATRLTIATIAVPMSDCWLSHAVCRATASTNAPTKPPTLRPVQPASAAAKRAVAEMPVHAMCPAGLMMPRSSRTSTVSVMLPFDWISVTNA